MALTLPRATLARADGEQEWASTLVPRYQRRMREVNETVVGTWPGATNAGSAARCNRR